MSKLILAVVLLVAFPGLSALASPKAARGQRAELEGEININTASVEELELLPGIGPAKAQKILEYRRLRRFRTIEELARVKGIGRKMLLRMRPHLTVSGATTASEPGKTGAAHPDAITAAGSATEAAGVSPSAAAAGVSPSPVMEREAGSSRTERPRGHSE